MCFTTPAATRGGKVPGGADNSLTIRADACWYTGPARETRVMRRRLRLLLVPFLAVVLPLVALAAIGYQWLALDREAAARRTRDAAQQEAVRVRAALLRRMAAAVDEIDREWPAASPDRPFALRIRPHPLVTEAYRFTAGGQLDEPDYDRAYRRAIGEYVGVAGAALSSGEGIPGAGGDNTQLAVALLDDGRRSLRGARPQLTVASVERILDCCAAARDEYGVSLAVLAARQMVAAWRQQGVLGAQLPGLMTRLVGLVDRGSIGHPNDVVDVEGFIHASGDSPLGEALLARVRESAETVARVMKTARRLTQWLAASGEVSSGSAPFKAAVINMDGREVMAGRHARARGGTVIVLFDTAALAASLAGGSQQGMAFEASLATGTAAPDDPAAARVPLLAEAPDLQVAVRPREGDAATQERRGSLFTAALLAALALTVIVGFYGLRDVDREVRLAAQHAGFVASVSHELKTPVASIRLLAETVRMRPSADAEETGPLLDEILEQADRQARLIDNVLGVARIDRGLPMYRPAEVDFDEAVGQALERLSYLLRQEGFAVVRMAPAEPVRVSVDREGLLQAITNLMTNAVKYSGRCREIRVEMSRAGEEARLQVVDGGIGIDPLEQRRIFERFYRTPDAARETGGTGLGLALVRHFAEAHGGRVTVESSPGRGSTFTLRLPLLTGGSSGPALNH